MTLINIRNLGVTMAAPLFAKLTLTVNKGDRLGLVAANGTGKSTLLSCLTGDLDPTTGDITTARGLRIAAVAQDLSQAYLTQTLYAHVLAALPPEQTDFESWRVDVVLDEFSIPFDLHHMPLSELSGGWQRQAMLAAAWVTQPDVLLLDEPTNHLDLGRIGLLQRWLGALPHDAAVIVVSHDRAFLDAITNRTLFLRADASRDFALPYSAARTALDAVDQADEKRFSNDMRQAQLLRKQAAKLKNIGINSGSDLLVKKTKQLQERAEKIETHARPGHQDHAAGDIMLGNSGTHAKALVTLDDIAVTTPDNRLLYRTGQKWIAAGDRIVILGQNGVGKTQLVRMIHAALTGEQSLIRVAPSVVLGYSDQDLSQLDLALTPLQVIAGQFDIGDQRARGLLAGAGMTIDMQAKPLTALSGGQKARLAMLVLRLTHPNFYLLDEPTNHLDIEGQEALEDTLVTQDTSCLIVSHDRSFIRAVANRYWWVDRKRLVEIDDPAPFFASELAQ